MVNNPLMANLDMAPNTSTCAACQWAQLSPHLNFARKQGFLLFKP